MRVLIVTPYPPLPLTHGARMRTFGLARGLARAGAAVELLCPWSPGQPRRPHERDGVRIVPHMFATNALSVLPDDLLPSVVASSWQPYALGPRRRLASLAGLDVVQFEFCAYPHWMTRLRDRVKLVYAAHNVEADLFAGARRRSRWQRAVLGRLMRLERATLAMSDLLIACTARDIERFRALYEIERPATVIPNGFDEALLAGAPSREEARAALGLRPDDTALLFHGGAARHNLEAVRYLVERLMPRLPAETRLLIAGKCATAARADEDAVKALGFVDDLRPLLAAADVGVNPVAYGSGSNIKLAEYLAAGLPVATTPVGARGYEQAGGAVHIASLEDFESAVRAAAGSRSAPPQGIAELSWDSLGRRLALIYRELTGAAASG